ncbi:MAG: Uma2 family endonuclease [Phormidesmis priestleyi]|uniref:Uma2 family endonuclease n=1 Tax=Phormidesmis priestleyi TaxID=268141 RepID=A0A2W4XK45_9CYAN|nr:MAG: Uma2 family endonuclease [Phormidesmis priestleyi]
MVVTSSSPSIKNRAYPSGEQRVIFNHLAWKDYLAILSAVGDTRSARLTYDQGRLEITMPLESHEFASELIGLFIRILVEELNLKIRSVGSTTLSYPQLEKSAEPDKGFYIQNQPLVAGRSLDLTQDPPPDLVLEVDITHTDIDKLSLYAAMGISEFWRFDGERLCIYILQGESYDQSEVSATFPTIPKAKLYQFLADSRQDEVEASRRLRQWVRENG